VKWLPAISTLTLLGCATAPTTAVPDADGQGDLLLVSGLPAISRRVTAYVELDRASCHQPAPDGIIRPPCLLLDDDSSCRPEVMAKLPPLPRLPSADLQSCSDQGYLLLKWVFRRGCLEGDPGPPTNVSLNDAQCQRRFPVFWSNLFLRSQWRGETAFDVRPDELSGLRRKAEQRLLAQQALEAREAAGCPSSSALIVGRADCEAHVHPDHLVSCAVENERPLCKVLREREREHVRFSETPEPERNICASIIRSEYERAGGMTHVWGSDQPAIEESCSRISPATFRQLDAQLATAW